MKEYYKEHSKRNYEKYGKDYYIKRYLNTKLSIFNEI